MLDKIFGPLARRWSWVATTLEVQKRFSEVRGGYLASAVTLNIFLSLFPLLLVAIAVMGFITNQSTDLPARIIGNLGLTGDAADAMNDALQHAVDTRRAASLIGLLGLTWSGLGVVGAIEYSIDATWQHSGRSFKDKGKGLIWGAGALAILTGSVGMTTLIKIHTSGIVLTIVSIGIAIAINFAFWMWTFNALSFKRIDWHSYTPGALLAAIGLEVIKQVAAAMPELFNGSSALYGSLGVMFVILTTLLLFGRLVVYASVLNVVKWEHGHGTLTVELEVPKVAPETPLEAHRDGTVDT